MQVHTADMASTQSQILERLERSEKTSAMWEQDQDYEWTGEPGSIEFDLEGDLVELSMPGSGMQMETFLPLLRSV